MALGTGENKMGIGTTLDISPDGRFYRFVIITAYLLKLINGNQAGFIRLIESSKVTDGLWMAPNPTFQEGIPFMSKVNSERKDETTEMNFSQADLPLGRSSSSTAS